MAAEPAERMRLFYSPAEAAGFMDCSDETVRRMIHDGLIAAERRGRRYRIPHSELARLRGARLGPTPEEEERRDLVRRARKLMAELVSVLAELE